MKPLIIQQTNSTLHVDFNPLAALLTLRGESYPENAIRFFEPVLSWLREYFSNLSSGASVKVDMDIVYFNSSSSKALMNCFDVMDEAAGRGIEVNICWRHHVENEVAKECGEEFAEELKTAIFIMAPYKDAE
ncbi:MAG: DUF1987 domain-containing protein [Desulfovibrio sp.]|nr:MAG: DUF1987 domain-containing protein [Desulfovibrio sp.]